MFNTKATIDADAFPRKFFQMILGHEVVIWSNHTMYIWSSVVWIGMMELIGAVSSWLSMTIE